MDTELITLAGILEYLYDDVNTIRIGQLKFKSDFVLHLRIDEIRVNAEVRASIKYKRYSISLIIAIIFGSRPTI